MDIALFNRLIFLQFPESVFSEEQKENYKRLEELRERGLTHLTVELMRYRHKMESSYASMFKETLKDIEDTLRGEPIEDRILNNWAVPLAAYRTLETALHIDLPYTLLFDICIKGIRTQSNECKTSSELGGFWNTVQWLMAQGEIIEGGDFKIKYMTFIKTNKVSMQWQEEHPVLIMQKSRIFMLYRQSGRSVGDVVLPEESLRYYLEHSKAYLGEKTYRFKVYNKGVPVYDKNRPNGNNGFCEAETVQRAYVFDYRKIIEAFDINLERANAESTDEEEAKAVPQEPQLPF